MLTKLTSSVAVVAMMALAAPAMAQSNTGSQSSSQQPSQQQSSQQSGSQQQAQSGQQQEQKEGAKLYVGANVITEVQKQLNKAGFDVGEVNGKLSDGTKSALENFQKENKLAATGELTIDTLETLGVDFMSMNQQQGGQADGEPAELKVGPSVVAQVQKALNEKGFDVGEVNGEWSEETAKAASAFQREQGMTESKNLNVGLLQTLGVSMTGGQTQAQAEMPTSEGAEATTLYIGPDVVKQVKMELNRQGFDAGSVDAEWTDDARTALKNYLEAQGVAMTEELTIGALSTLGIDWRSGGSQGGSTQQGGSMQMQGTTGGTTGTTGGTTVKVIQ